MIDALGNIGDFVGGIGVVVTLAYLAVQIRHSSKVAALAAGHTISLGLTEFQERIAMEPELHSFWTRALASPESLDEMERDRFGRLILGLLVRCLDAHRHRELDAGIAERFDHLARHYLSLSAVQAWWTENGELLHRINPELAVYIGEQLEISRRTEPPAT
jgi:hypothetical protein